MHENESIRVEVVPVIRGLARALRAGRCAIVDWPLYRGVTMRLKSSAGRSGAMLLGMMVLVLPLAATPAEPTVAVTEVTPIAANIASQRLQMWQIGLRFKSAFEFYHALEKQEHGGQPIT